LTAATPRPLAAQELDALTRLRVDSVFRRFDRTDSPGCALLVRKDGRTAYARGGVAITPQSVMDIGSTSKQFTAAAIWLLAQDGKLGLDDEAQKYLPALPRLGAPVTIRHLLQHTSGWRDYTALLSLGGASDAEVTTAADAMTILAAQKAGNFAPGSWWTYSNTGFFLASQIVERVSGMSMRQFLRTRLFAPLGMTHTDLFDDHRRIFKNKVPSYAPANGGWRVDIANWEQTGDGAVQTSVEDLARWDANFDSPTVGGRPLMESMQQPGHLNDGTPLTYAYGLNVDRYRGLRRVHHGGAWAGYRAMSMRFPDQRTSVYLTCNAANANTMALTEGVASAVLAPVLVSTSPFGGHERRLMQLPDGRLTDLPVDDTPMRSRVEPATGEIVVDYGSFPPDRFSKVREVGTLTPAKLAEYAGRYATPEVPSVWTIEARGDSLFLTTVSGTRHSSQQLEPLFADAFIADGPPLRFVRDARGRVIVISVTGRGARVLRWLRVAP